MYLFCFRFFIKMTQKQMYYEREMFSQKCGIIELAGAEIEQFKK